MLTTLSRTRRLELVSGGEWHSCGPTKDGSFACVHTSAGSQVPQGVSSHGFGSVSDRVLALVSTGNRFTCALDPDGVPVCWGIDDYGQTSPPEGEHFTTLSSGSRHVCALRADGTPVCWGDPAQGRTASPPDETFVDITTGWAHTCALRADGAPRLLGS